VGWGCSSDVGVKKCLQKFGGESSLKTATMENYGENMRIILRRISEKDIWTRWKRGTAFAVMNVHSLFSES
jgi:hypothetical protein